MASDLSIERYARLIIGKWHIGIGSGIAAVIPIILFSNVIGGKELFPLFGLFPFAIIWGLVYVGLAEIDRINEIATEPATGVVLGVVYSFVVWWGPQAGKPVGEFVSVNSAIQVLLFGIVIGIVYAYSPNH